MSGLTLGKTVQPIMCIDTWDRVPLCLTHIQNQATNPCLAFLPLMSWNVSAKLPLGLWPWNSQIHYSAPVPSSITSLISLETVSHHDHFPEMAFKNLIRPKSLKRNLKGQEPARKGQFFDKSPTWKTKITSHGCWKDDYEECKAF